MNSGSVSRWDDPAALRRDHTAALRRVKQQGIIFSDDPQARAAIREAFAKIFLALPDVVRNSSLSLLYPYEMSRQPPEISTCDGFSSVSEHFQNGRQVASIGISVEAIRRGPDYTALIALHELAHITLDSRFAKGQHGGMFHLWLDYLLLEYNKFHGKNVRNDYFMGENEHE